MKNINKAVLAVGAGFFALSSFTTNKVVITTSSTLLSDTITDIIAPGTELKLISDKFGFAEGPTTDKKGNIFFTDMPNNRINKYDTDGNLTVFLEPAGRPNGMFMDSKGNLIVCSEKFSVVKTDLPVTYSSIKAALSSTRPLECP